MLVEKGCDEGSEIRAVLAYRAAIGQERSH
jgi:hypothetical protein